MKLRRVALAEARGHILAHNVSHSGRRLLRKGCRLGDEQLAALESHRVGQITVAQLEPTDVEEDAAALRIASALSASGLEVHVASGGRVMLRAQGAGLLTVDSARLLALNELEGVTLATLPSYTTVQPREVVATLKIIPFALSKQQVERAERLAATSIVAVVDLGSRTVRLVVFGSAALSERLLAVYRRPLEARLSRLGCRGLEAQYVDVGGEDPQASLCAVLSAHLAAEVDLVILAGETATMDHDDLAPAAIRQAGGAVEVVGAPVFPGNLLLLAYHGRTALMGAPGCVRSMAANVVDRVLPRLLVGERLGRRQVAELGQGGLLTRSAETQTEGLAPDVLGHD